MQRRPSLRVFLSLPAWLVLATTSVQAAGYDIPAHYDKFEYRIPMRDGVRLFTAVYIPKDRSRTYPILMTRTPYSVAPYGADHFPEKLGPSELFAPEGFIFVYQDVRGRFMSEGEFVNVRPYIRDKGPGDVDENTDTYDTVEWLLQNVPNHNGRVGIYGISYPGFYTAYGIIDGHPAIKAASPQAPVAEWFIGDDFHHHGAFFLQDAFHFFSRFGKPRPEPTTQWPPRFDYGTADAYRFFLDLGPLRNVDLRYFKGEIAFWKDLMEHGTYDEFWRARNLIQHMHGVKAAVMTVAGLFDAEDPYGPVRIYQAIERNCPGIYNVFVLGPWSHGGWSRMRGDRLGNIRFYQATGEYYRRDVELAFFRRFLKDEGELEQPEALVFLTGANTWRRFEQWPPARVREATLYFREGGVLAWDAPEAAGEAYDEYLSDPARPVPYTQEIQITRSIEYMVEDQRFAARRPDVLAYQTPVLERDVTVVGPVEVRLFVSSTGTDADYVVKLIDVFPEDYPELPEAEKHLKVPMGGYQMLVRGEVMRAKFRNSYSAPEPLEPGVVTPVKFAMPDVAHTFKRGHRIMVQVQSSWFPLVDRNPQKFLDIYSARETDFQKAYQRIHRSRAAASHLVLRLLED
ncbi:MAG: CocE/NonD family hydrolase [Acidobacteriota bacterium]